MSKTAKILAKQFDEKTIKILIYNFDIFIKKGIHPKLVGTTGTTHF